MAALTWDAVGEREYETGVDKGVLYPMASGAYTTGVAWNGLTGVTESPSGAEPTAHYADNIKYLNIMSSEDFGGTIEAFTYPEEFSACNGEASVATGISISQQNRSPFGFCYRTKIGNDSDGVDHGYKIHCVYNALAKPSEKANATINESTEPLAMSWEFSTTPIAVTGKKPTAHLIIDSRTVSAANLATLEAKLYGGADTQPTLLTPDEIVALIAPEPEPENNGEAAG